jgi:hypothetical protein
MDPISNPKTMPVKPLKLLTFICLTAPLFLFCACSSVKVTTDYDHGAAFGKYHSYALEPSTNVSALSPTADAALRTSLRENLAMRGIREIGADEKPELAVVPHVKLQEKYSLEQYTHSGYGPGVWPYYGGYYGVWSGAPYTYSSINNYTEGTLILDFVDLSNRKLVFRGIGTAVVSANTENNAKKIEQAVRKIVAKMPTAQPGSVAGNL